MRHVSRTHIVALDWLLDRINLEPKIQTKYVDTKTQLADILTKRKFTRDEWNHLLRFFNVTNFSMFSCSHFLANRKQSTMSKSAQEMKIEEEPAQAKPRSARLVSWKLLRAKANLFVRFGSFRRPGESRVGSKCCVREHRETCARQGPGPSNEFSSVAKR